RLAKSGSWARRRPSRSREHRRGRRGARDIALFGRGHNTLAAELRGVVETTGAVVRHVGVEKDDRADVWQYLLDGTRYHPASVGVADQEVLRAHWSAARFVL